MKDKAIIHFACYIKGRESPFMVNGEKTRIDFISANGTSPSIGTTGIFSLAVVDLGDEIYRRGYVFGRGWSLPDGVRQYEAVLVGQDLGEFLSQKGVSQYEVLDNPQLLPGVGSWGAHGPLDAYEEGIRSVLGK